MTDITLILPAYNEAKTIESTIEHAKSYFESRKLSFEIIVAADGLDGTRDIVKRLALSDPRLKVIGQDERSGKGRGVREAVALASGDIIGFADADNKVPIEEFDRFYECLQTGTPVVIGTRATAASVIERRPPFHRRIGSRLFTVGLRVIIGRLATDTQCGFKFFSREAAKKIFRLQHIDGYMFDVEVLALAASFGLKQCEIPVRWRDDGDTRLQLFRGNVQNFVDLVRIRIALARLRPEENGALAAASGRR